MRKITYCLILFLFIYPLSLMADNGLNESVLKELDRVIEEKYSFHVHKEKEIDEIKARLHRSGNNEEKYELCGSLFYLYLHYQADSSLYYRFLSVRLNRLKNKLLANYLRNRGNDLATVRNSAFCVAILSNNSFICKYNIFFRKYELSVAIL